MHSICNTYVYNVGLQPSCNSIGLELKSNGAGVFIGDGWDGKTVVCDSDEDVDKSGTNPAALSWLDSPFVPPLLTAGIKLDVQLNNEKVKSKNGSFLDSKSNSSIYTTNVWLFSE